MGAFAADNAAARGPLSAVLELRPDSSSNPSRAKTHASGISGLASALRKKILAASRSLPPTGRNLRSGGGLRRGIGTSAFQRSERTSHPYDRSRAAFHFARE